jgi:hypothetical protein
VGTQEQAELMTKQIIALSDVVGYSSPMRTSDDRRAIRNAIWKITTTVFGSDVDMWYEGRGDGILTVLPSTITPVWVYQEFEDTVTSRLQTYNNSVRPGRRISLRVAIDYGIVDQDSMGPNGDCMIRAGRLIDSKIFRNAVCATRATVGIVTPSELTRQFSLDGYANVRTQVKGMSLYASMRMI